MYSLILGHLLWKDFAELGDQKALKFRHGVNLPFDLLVPRQGSLQTFLGVQLRVSTLVNVFKDLQRYVDLMKLLTAFLDVLQSRYHEI